MHHRDLLSGFIRLHILHHPAEGELYGQGMIEELARHGYRMSPGTLYPLLHGLEKKGCLVHAWSVTGAQPESIIGQTVSATRQSNRHGEGKRVVWRNRARSAAQSKE